MPISRTIVPPLPTRICFCDSVSTKTVARTTFSPSSSTSTVSACGTSSRVRCSAFSRTSSGHLLLDARSVRWPTGKYVGPRAGADELVAQLADAVAGLCRDGMERMEVAELRRRLHLLRDVPGLSRSTLFSAITTGTPSPKTF